MWCPTVPFGDLQHRGELARARRALAQHHHDACAERVAERAELLRVLDDEHVVEVVVGITVDDCGTYGNSRPFARLRRARRPGSWEPGLPPSAVPLRLRLERALRTGGRRQRERRLLRHRLTGDIVDRLGREREREHRERDQVAVDVERVVAVVRERVAGLVVARVELRIRPCRPRSPACSAVFSSSAPVKRPPEAMSLSMNAW